MEIETIVAVIILIAFTFFAIIDMAFSHLSDVGLRRISSDDELVGKESSVTFLREILEHRPRFRFALSSVIQILLICFTVILTVIISEYTIGKVRLLTVSLIIGLVATVLFRQIIPRLLVRKNAEKKLVFLLPAIRPIYRLVSFFVDPIANRTDQKQRQNADSTFVPDFVDDRTEDNVEDFQALMEVGEAEGIIEEKERELIETVVEFSDTRAGEIMTPRTEIVALPIGSTVKDARDLIDEQKYSRLPVYSDSIDNIEGMVYVRDLLHAWADGKEDQPVKEILREAFFVPETKTASELLKDMQSSRVQIAVVIDEYGGVAGLITVEDILEEIVGEIEDEDTDQEEILEIIEGTDGYYDVVGSTEIDKIERLFDIDLEDEEYNTIAGMVTSETGYVPKNGEQLNIRGLAVEILNADEKKLHLLRLRRADEDESGSADISTE